MTDINLSYIEALLRDIRVKKKPHISNICSGNLNEHEYKRLCGILRGLEISENSILENFNKYFGNPKILLSSMEMENEESR